jgi:hypothetical protein
MGGIRGDTILNSNNDILRTSRRCSRYDFKEGL